MPDGARPGRPASPLMRTAFSSLLDEFEDSAAQPPPDDLPPGFTAVFSPQHRAFFYRQKSTNQTTWRHPTADPATGGAPRSPEKRRGSTLKAALLPNGVAKVLASPTRERSPLSPEKTEPFRGAGAGALPSQGGGIDSRRRHRGSGSHNDGGNATGGASGEMRAGEKRAVDVELEDALRQRLPSAWSHKYPRRYMPPPDASSVPNGAEATPRKALAAEFGGRPTVPPASPLLAEYNSNLDDLQRRLQETVPRASRSSSSTPRGSTQPEPPAHPLPAPIVTHTTTDGRRGSQGARSSLGGEEGGEIESTEGEGVGGGDGEGGESIAQHPRTFRDPAPTQRSPLVRPSSPRLDSAIMQLTMALGGQRQGSDQGQDPSQGTARSSAPRAHLAPHLPPTYPQAGTLGGGDGAGVDPPHRAGGSSAQRGSSNESVLRSPPKSMRRLRDRERDNMSPEENMDT